MVLLELDALMPKAKVRVLQQLLLHAERSFYQRELAQRTGLRLRAVQQALEPLVAAAIILREERGHQVFYRANPDCPVLPELTGLLVKTVGVVGPLREALLRLGEDVVVALLFGSLASGMFRPGSDVDVLVLGTATPLAVVDALRPAARVLGREINPVVMGTEELQDRVANDDPFITNVLTGPVSFIIGGRDELAELAGPETA